MSRRHRATVAVEWSPRGVVVFDGASRQERRFDDLTQATGLGGKVAIVGVSRRSLFVRTTRVPDADPATVRQVLGMRTGELFPVAPGEVAVDYLPLGDVNADGRLALVVAIPAGDLRRIRQEAASTGLRIESVVPVALGSAIVARSMGQLESAVVSRDSGGLGIDVVSNGDLRHSRAIPEAAALEAEVCRTFQVAGLPCGDMLLGPGVDYLGGAKATMSPLEALANHWPEEWHLNLELREEVEARTRAETRNRMRFSVLLATAAFGLLAFVAEDYGGRAESVRRQVARENAEIRKLELIQKENEAKATRMVALQKSLDRAFRPAQRVGDVIALMANRVPAGAWLAGVSIERGKPIVLRGTSTNGQSVTAYVNRLNAENRLRDVQLIFATNSEIEETPVVQFSVSAFPVGNVPLADSTNRRRRAASTTAKR